MESLHQFIHENFLLVFAFGFAWPVIVFGIMLWRRNRRGLVIPKVAGPDVVFVEKFASGSSHKSFMTRVGGASNCLTVIVTKTHLAVTTFFPFTALAGTYDLEHVIPVSDITTLTPKGKAIEVEFQRMDGTQCKLSLRLRDPAGFLRALEPKPNNSEQAAPPAFPKNEKT